MAISLYAAFRCTIKEHICWCHVTELRKLAFAVRRYVDWHATSIVSFQMDFQVGNSVRSRTKMTQRGINSFLLLLLILFVVLSSFRHTWYFRTQLIDSSEKKEASRRNKMRRKTKKKPH